MGEASGALKYKMSLITINANLDKLTLVLERIANALDRAYPDIPLPTHPSAPYGPDSLITVTDEQLWEQEQETERLKQLEQK